MAVTSHKKTGIVIPCVVITLGTGWLLTTKLIMPGVDWVWVLGLGVMGVLVLALSGINKVTIVVGPILIIATFLSILRQTGRLSVDTEIPILVIIIGILMLSSHIFPVPPPDWRHKSDGDSD